MLAKRVCSLVQFSLKKISLMTCMKLSLSYLIGHMIPAKATRNTIVANSVYVVCYRRDNTANAVPPIPPLFAWCHVFMYRHAISYATAPYITMA